MTVSRVACESIDSMTVWRVAGEWIDPMTRRAARASCSMDGQVCAAWCEQVDEKHLLFPALPTI